MGNAVNDNQDLRESAVRAITNYMHHELFALTQSTNMLPFMREQANALLDGIDRAIDSTRSHRMAEYILAMNTPKQ